MRSTRRRAPYRHSYGIDDAARRLAYAVIEGRVPLLHHHASLQVFAGGESRSRLVWITDVLPHDLATEIRLRVERGAVVMKQTLESEAGRLEECGGGIQPLH